MSLLLTQNDAKGRGLSERSVRVVGGRIRQRVLTSTTKPAWRTAAWCETHEDLAWRYGDGSVSCMHQLVVEESSGRGCTVRALQTRETARSLKTKAEVG